MAQTAFPPADRITDGNGLIISGAKLFFYDAETLDQRTVYQDAALTVPWTQPVVCDSAGLVPAIYVPTGLYRVIVTNADESVTIDDVDNQNGPIDTSALTTTEAKPLTTVSSVTSTTQLVAADMGTVVNANPGGGSFTITLPAASVGNGKNVQIRNIGLTGTVTVDGGLSTIDGASSRAIDRQFQSEVYVSDGANWHVNNGVLIAKHLTQTLTDAANIDWDMRQAEDASVTLTADRILDPPDSPIVGQEGELLVYQDVTGGWDLEFSSVYKFSGDIVQAISKESNARTAYRYKVIGVSDILLQRIWPVAAPGVFEVVYEVPNDTLPVAAVVGAWTKSPIATTLTNDLTGASLTTNVITLPAGVYNIEAYHTLFSQNSGQARLKNTTDDVDIALSPVLSENVSLTQGYRTMIIPRTRLTITAEKTFELQYFQETGTSFAGTSPVTFGTPTRPAWVGVERLA